jgi:ribonuclease VapC
VIIDTSAIIAILFEEEDAAGYAEALAASASCRISAATYVEASIVVESQTKSRGSRQLDALMNRAGIVIEPVTETQAQLARQAYADFGKGRHRAGLNYGDCFSYALAKDLRQPLLFKGNDFSKTDLESAM